MDIMPARLMPKCKPPTLRLEIMDGHPGYTTGGLSPQRNPLSPREAQRHFKVENGTQTRTHT